MQVNKNTCRSLPAIERQLYINWNLYNKKERGKQANNISTELISCLSPVGLIRYSTGLPYRKVGTSQVNTQGNKTTDEIVLPCFDNYKWLDILFFSDKNENLRQKQKCDVPSVYCCSRSTSIFKLTYT